MIGSSRMSMSILNRREGQLQLQIAMELLNHPDKIHGRELLSITAHLLNKRVIMW